MRKITLLFFSVLILINFSGCKKEPAPIVTDFSGKFTALCNGVELAGKAVINSNKMVSLTISSPDAMKGYTYTYKGNQLVIEFNNMKIETQDTYLPKTAFPSIVYNIFKSLKKENNCYLDSTTDLFANYRGSCDSGNYEIVTQFSMGTISEIRIHDIDFYIKFRAVEIIS